MATQEYRIVSGTDSEIHDEPHVAGSRVTVRRIHARVEQLGHDPSTVAEEQGLSVGDVYDALAYYHRNPEEMRRVEARHREAVSEAESRSSLAPDE